MRFQARTNNGIVTAWGHKLRLKEFPDLELVIHRFAITDYKTGFKIAGGTDLKLTTMHATSILRKDENMSKVLEYHQSHSIE